MVRKEHCVPIIRDSLQKFVARLDQLNASFAIRHGSLSILISGFQRNRVREIFARYEETIMGEKERKRKKR